MRSSKKRLPIPQHEFGFAPDTFTLFSEKGVDGERLAREREQAEQSKRQAEAVQARLFAVAH